MLDLKGMLASETPRIEWKQNADASDVLQAVCALANDLENSEQPGFVLLGVDKRGQVVGVTDKRGQPVPPSGSANDERQQSLASRIKSIKLWPQPSIAIESQDCDGKTVFIISVEPYPVPPEVTLDGVAYVRVGTTTHKANQADLIRLRERRPLNRQPFDLRPVLGATLGDLDAHELQIRYNLAKEDAENPESFPSLTEWLAQKNLGREQDGAFCPNAAALLVFGKDPQSHLPSAFIEIVRYAGDNVDAEVAWRKTLTGTVTDQLNAAWMLFETVLLSRPVSDDGMRSVYREEYPPRALRELARNLVQHRLYEGTNAPGRIEWFEDHIELSNPGGRFGRASEGAFGSHSDYRNPTLTQLLVEAGHVEQLGRGIRVVRRQLADNGNPPLEVETDGFTRVIVRRQP